MSDLADLPALFHFLRPAWLLAVPAVAFVWWLVRRRRGASQGWRTHMAPHLLTSLTLNSHDRRRVRPVDMVAVALLCTAIAAAGPTWRRLPNPFFSETAPLAIVLEVSETMLANDLSPTRLERAKLKILDLVRLRAGARNALVAFAGSAHMILPLTEDPEILKPFLESLDPGIMPRAGQDAAAALTLADNLLAKEATPGTILFVTDGIDPTDIAAFATYRAQDGAHGIVALVVGSDEGGSVELPDGGFLVDANGKRVTAAVDRALLRRWDREGGVTIIRATLGDADIEGVERRVLSNLRSALDADDRAAWDDQGWLLIWPAALLSLLWFRRGWTMQWVWLLLLAGGLMAPGAARAEGFWDLWLTPDQQGRYAFDHKRFSEAADLFQNPLWKGVAAYRAGRYEEAAQSFARVPSAEAAFNMGNALVKGREYDKAVIAFQQALAEDPDHDGARRNLEITQAIIKRLNRVRQQEDTGEQTELGADEFKFDNKTGEGKEIIITGQSNLRLESADQWMRSVDTGPRDFLKTKFALEAAKGKIP